MTHIKVVKIGGKIVDDEKALKSFLENFSALEHPKVLVHGGGVALSQMAEKLGLPIKMVNGRRVTDSETLKLAAMVYGGYINKNIVAQLQAFNCNAIGLSGADANVIMAHKRPKKPIDYGYVGDVFKVNASALHLFIAQHIIPVLCAITHNAKGQLLNTNADTIASEIAIALSKRYKVSLYYCFEKKGILENVTDDNSVIKQINSNNYSQLIEDKVISDGMLPKTKNCFHALNNGVSKVCIGNSEMMFKSKNQFTTLTK